MAANVLLSLDDRVAHLPGPVHGVALCGEVMRDPWMSTPFAHDRASDWCEWCFDRAATDRG